MVLSGDNSNAVPVATELSEDLDAKIVGVGTTGWSRLLRSRHCDVGVTTVPTSHPKFGERLLTLLDQHEPDLLLPLGYAAVASTSAVREDIPDGIECWLPPWYSLDIAIDKQRTASFATGLDIGTPEEYSENVWEMDERGRRDEIERLPFPLFLKSRFEQGRTVTAEVEDPSEFWDTYEELVAEGETDVVVQEHVPGERTYGCGLLFEHGTPRLTVGHEEVRSIPRRGGTGTRVRLFRDSHMEIAALRLLDALEWHGPALVEFKRRPDGSYVLMEINPKFWASYALASESGYRFASTIAARALDLPLPRPREVPDQSREMVFPLRELFYAVSTSDESLLRSVASMSWPPASMDVNLRDLGGWLTPPARLRNIDEDAGDVKPRTDDRQVDPHREADHAQTRN